MRVTKSATLRVLALIVLGAFAFGAYGKSPVEMEVNPVGGKYVKVSVSAESDAFRLYIENALNNEVFYETRVSGSDFTKVFDFSKLSNGEYVVRIKSGREESEVNVRVSDNLAFIPAKSEHSKPLFYKNGGLLTVSYINSELNPVKLKVESSSAIHYEETVHKNLNLMKRFDISNLNPGNYSVILEDGKNVYNYSLNVER